MGVWNSGVLSPPGGGGGMYGMGGATGSTFDFTFMQPGTFPYHCSLHPPSLYPGFTGTVTGYPVAVISALLLPPYYSSASRPPLAVRRAATPRSGSGSTTMAGSFPGDHAKVQVRTQYDGYLIVVHVDPDGYLRVLFPLDPDKDNFVRGGKKYEVRDRGGRESFVLAGMAGA